MNYSLDIFEEFLYLDSEYNLRWKTNRPRCKKDSLAGSFNSEGYVQIHLNGVNYYGHRIVYQMVNRLHILPSEIMLDHIDGNKSNNNPTNLRIATKSTNAMNRGKQSNNSSGYKGVSFRKDIRKWLAKITKEGKAFHIGTFNTKEEAALAYCQAASEIHGEFTTRINSISNSSFPSHS